MENQETLAILDTKQDTRRRKTQHNTTQKTKKMNNHGPQQKPGMKGKQISSLIPNYFSVNRKSMK
jgi:hypothetical protein